MKRFLAMIWTLGLLLAMAGCGGKEAPGSDSGGSKGGGKEPDNFPVVVNNEDIPAKPGAVVSLSPGTTEMLFAMGYGGRVVGIGAYDDYPTAEMDRHHRCGTVLSPDREAIRGLEPDLLVAAAPLIESDLVWFQQQNIPVLVLPRADTLDALEANYTALATALDGKTDGAAAGASYWAGLTDKLTEAKALSQGQEPVTAILLREMNYGMATGDTFEQELFEAVGLINDAQGFDNWLYDREEVAALDPQVIFADSTISPDTIKQSAVYKPVRAVQSGKVMNVDLAVFERQSPRMFDTLLAMAEYACKE